jgi:hypothetical protein
MIGGGGLGRLIKGDVQDQALFSNLEALLISTRFISSLVNSEVEVIFLHSFATYVHLRGVNPR